jgi:CDP-6-deoxy-D-xylo-4-hexulose-3-dehydrase
MADEWFYPTGFKLWNHQEQEAIQRVIASDRFTYGPETEALEHELADYHGRRFCVAVNSGSSANWIAVAALFHVQNEPLRRGDFAAVPSIAWATTWAPLMVYGLDLVVADADETWNSIPGKCDYLKPRLAVCCPILGNPAHLEDWMRWHQQARMGEQHVYMIEDACESLGAVAANGYKVGTFGDMSTLSFFMSHQIAGIEGGAVLCDDPELYCLLKQLRNHGWSRDTEKPSDFAGEYCFVVPGTNTRPLEINAAVQRSQLRKLDGFVTERRKNLGLFWDMVAGLPIKPQKLEGIASPFGITFTVEDKTTREHLAKQLRANGIDCRLPTGGNFERHPMSRLSRIWSADHHRAPNADLLHDTGAFLGLAPFPIPEKIERAVKVMKDVFGKVPA